MLSSHTTLPHSVLTFLLAAPLSCSPAEQDGQVSDPQGCRTVILPADSTTTGTDQDSTSYSGSSGGISTTTAAASSDPSTAGTATSDGTTSTHDPTATDPSTTGGFDTCSFLGCGTTGMVDVACDIWAQDCPDGEKCTAWANDGGGSWNDSKCVPVDPTPKQPGDECTAQGSGVSGLDDCDKGSMCWDTNKENIGYCIEFCMGSADAPFCSDPQALCQIANDGVLPICLPSCDPLLQDCPGVDYACLPLNDGFVCIPDGSGPDAGADGDPCEYANACDPGLFCATADFVPGCKTAGCCSSFCDLDAPNTCPLKAQGAECQPFYEMGMAPPGKENLGVCGLPP